MKVDLSSPESLVESLHQATVAQDYGAILECFDARSFGRQADEMLVIARDYAKKVMDVRGLLEDTVGAEEGKEFMDAFGFPPRSPFATRGADRDIDWSRITVTINGKKAVITTPDGTRIDAVRSEGAWRIIDGSSFIPPSSLVRHSVAERERALERIRRAAHAGRINKGNFRMVLYPDAPPGTWEPYGPWTDGVRISIYPRQSRFKAGGPYEFEVRIEYAREVCFRVPREMIGENTVLEIDGKAISVPQIEADDVVGAFAGMRTDGATMRFPRSLTVGSGQHTLRYGIVSHGGQCQSPSWQLVEMVNGTILSNVVSFEVE